MSSTRAAGASGGPRLLPGELADEIAVWTSAQVETLIARHLPDLRVPRVFAGYPVGSDVRADLAYTLGLLDACGQGTVAGRSAAESIPAVLRAIDGPATHTFFSYRVAETLARAGRFADHPWLADFSEAERANLAEACDSTSWCALLDAGQLPANYAAVLARCEVARSRLGLAIDGARLDRLIERTVALLTRSALGWHDDSPVHAGRYDIYLADLYLFLEPLAEDAVFAPRLAAAWARGARSAIGLVERVGARNGAAFPWGRSTGALAICLTIELGALALVRGWGGNPALWLARTADAFARFAGWMHDGLIAAHRHRSPYSYRGPERRLQMTLDCLGKLAWAAAALRQAPAGPAPADEESFPAADDLIELSSAPRAAVWAYRGRGVAFALPLVGSTLNDYLPAPQCPGFLEVPVETDLPTGLPFAVRHGRRFAPGGPPVAIEHAPGRLRVSWDRLPRTGEWDVAAERPALAGSCSAAFDVRGGRLSARARLVFDELPDALSLVVAESAARRLRVGFECRQPHAVATIDTSGVKEYRSFWGELPRMHQIDVEPAREVELAWTIAPVLRVATSASPHHYNRALYDPLVGCVEERQLPYEWFRDPSAADPGFLDDLDLFHLHWPEWTSHDPHAHRALIARLREHRVRIVWTQHNLLPHSRDPALAGLYALWAEAADGVIHHSRWGEARVRAAHPFRADAIHRVIPHPHFGHLAAATVAASDAGSAERRRTRIEVERELELRPCAIRLGVVGAPRPEKDVQLLLDAFAACRRDDLGLVVLSLGPADRISDDPRIRALAYEMVPREVYDRRLCAIDALVFPIRAGDLLTSGVVGDAVAFGLPSLVSDWPFLSEALGEAAIPYGSSRAELTACLDALSVDELARAGAAARLLQPVLARERIAALTLALLDEVGSAKI
jgi:glycosyltransferase involved in cell wall biosynthesis